MEKRIFGLAIAFMLVLALAPTAMADEELPADGTATVNNSTPSVTLVEIHTVGNGTITELAPWVYYEIRVAVSDANTLEDIDNIVVKMWTTVGEGGDDAVRNHYTFKYTAGTPTWEEIGPDSETDSHIELAGCVEASPLTGTSGTYVFKVRLAYVAEPTTGTLWTAKAIATDDNEASGDNLTTFDVNDYISLAIDDSTLTFSGAPGAVDVTPNEEQTVATVTSNNIFNVNVRLSADWSGTEHGGSIPAGNTDAAQTEGKAGIQELSTAYVTLWPNVAYGESVAKDCYWFLEIPSPCRDDSYTTIAYVQAVKVV